MKGLWDLSDLQLHWEREIFMILMLDELRAEVEGQAIGLSGLALAREL